MASTSYVLNLTSRSMSPFTGPPSPSRQERADQRQRLPGSYDRFTGSDMRHRLIWSWVVNGRDGLGVVGLARRFYL